MDDEEQVWRLMTIFVWLCLVAIMVSDCLFH